MYIITRQVNYHITFITLQYSYLKLPCQPVRRTKRRELNKQSKKQHVRRYRQQTPPPPNYIILDDDSEEYDKQKNGKACLLL